MFVGVFLVIIYFSKAKCYGYDSGTDQGACGKPYRSARVLQPPCDLALETFCTSAGTTYPWHAVRRFIRENQGLMRRMYGDQRHMSVLREELETNDLEGFGFYSQPDYDLYGNGDFKSRYAKQDVEFGNELYQHDENTPRLLQDITKNDDIMNTRLVFSEPTKSVKIGDLRTVPHFISTTQKIIETNTPTATTSTTTTSTSSVGKFVDPNISEHPTETLYEKDNQTATETTTDRTTTEGSTTVTTTNNEEMTTEHFKKKATIGAVLFQDMVDNKEKVPPVMNYKVQGVNACPVKQDLVAPFWANNTRGEVLSVLNLHPFEQYVHLEICTYEHRQMYCRDGCKCEQQYRLHRLLAYDPNNECRGIFSDWFKFPACCICKCYDIPEFRVTSRSPRNKEDKYVPSWFKKKNVPHFQTG